MVVVFVYNNNFMGKFVFIWDDVYDIESFDDLCFENGIDFGVLFFKSLGNGCDVFIYICLKFS